MPSSEYDALLASPPAQPKSEYDQLLTQPPQPQQSGGVGQALKNAGQAAVNVAKGFVTGLLPRMEKSTLAEIALGPAAIGPIEAYKTLQGVGETVKGVQQAETTPPFSRERFEAGFNVAAQLGMLALGGRPKLRDVAFGKPKPETLAETAAESEVIKNAQEPYSKTSPVSTEQGKPAQQEAAVQTETRDTRQTPAEVSAQTVGKVRQFSTAWDERGGLESKAMMSPKEFARFQYGTVPPDEVLPTIEANHKQVVADALANGLKANPEAIKKYGLETVAPVPQPEQPQIISTAVQTPEGIKTGTFNQPHEEIVQGAPEEQKGFIVRNADGTERFVGRAEAADVAKAAGQVKPENAGTTELHSQQLTSPQIPKGGEQLPSVGKTKTKGGEVSEKVQKGQDEGQGWEGVLGTVPSEQPPEPPSVPPVQTSSTEPHVSAIANRFTQERVKQGEIGEIVPGQGHSTEELVQRGLKMSLEEIKQHVSDLNEGTGDIVKQGQAVRAEEARLSQRSNQASRELEADPNNTEKKLAADNAFKDLTDFHNGPVALLKNKWHATGMEMQGEIPIDLSTFNGMREAWLKDIGTAPPPEVEPMLRQTAKKVAGANGEADAAINKVSQAIDKVTKGRKTLDYEQVRNAILERLKGRTPCN